jgi:hypothetical protein
MYKQEIITNIKYKQYLLDFTTNNQVKDDGPKTDHSLITKFIPEVEKINISNELIATLEKEFELFKIKVQKIMKKYSGD